MWVLCQYFTVLSPPTVGHCSFVFLMEIFSLKESSYSLLLNHSFHNKKMFRVEDEHTHLFTITIFKLRQRDVSISNVHLLNTTKRLKRFNQDFKFISSKWKFFKWNRKLNIEKQDYVHLNKTPNYNWCFIYRIWWCDQAKWFGTCKYCF